MGSAEKHDVGVLLGTGDGAGRQGIARITMKENDFGMESGKSKETLRGLRKLAAVGSIAAAAFSLSACEGTASAEQSGGQSGGTVASEGNTVCNTETGAVVAKKDGMDPSVFKEPSVCETITPAPVNTETATPEPSETKTLETDSDWVDKEFLQKISIDYDSFDGWESKDNLAKYKACGQLFANNGIDYIPSDAQGTQWKLNNSMTGQEIVDHWNKQSAVIWSVVNDRSDKRNGDIAKKLTECITSDDLDASTIYGVRDRADDSIDYLLEVSDGPVAPDYVFEKITKQSDRIFIVEPTSEREGGWDAYVIEGRVAQPGPFGTTHANIQAIFKLQWFEGGSPLWQLVAQKDMGSDTEDITTGMTQNLHDVE